MATSRLRQLQKAITTGFKVTKAALRRAEDADAAEVRAVVARNMALNTRQDQRHRLFRAAFSEITNKYGGEERRRRRSIARVVAKRRWAALKAA